MERWRKVFAGMDRFHEQVIQNGQIILSYQQKQNAKTAKAIWFPVEFAGHKWMAINQGGVNSQCWDSVWNDDFDTFSNVINVYINYLRKKIDSGFEKKLIHSIRGTGYILKED